MPHLVGNAPRAYIAAVAASRESSTGSSYTTPTASFFRGFGFRFGHPFAGTRGGSHHPRVSNPPLSLFLSLFLSLSVSVSLSFSLYLSYLLPPLSLHSYFSDLPSFPSCQPLSQ